MPLYQVLLGFFLAAVPGILVALLSHRLDVNDRAKRAALASANARRLLELEILGNRTALADFWKLINGLDDANNPQDSEQHLAQMIVHGVLSYVLPLWSTARWNANHPEWLDVISTAEIEQINRFYRDLQGITDLYAQVIRFPFTPEEAKELEQQRFWYNHVAGWRLPIFKRLVAIADPLLARPLPLQAVRQP